MIAIASPMLLAQKGLMTATLSKDQMIASFLAQDAIESIKNIRDQNAIRGNTSNWLAGLDDCLCSDNKCNFNISGFKACAIDTTFNSATTTDASFDHSLALLKISKDSNGNFLKYDYLGVNGESSKFYRFFNIRQTAPTGTASDEAEISVRVLWDAAQGPQTMDIQDFIYNYSENIPTQ